MGFINRAQRSTPPYYLDVDNPLWWNSKAEIVTKFKKTWFVMKLKNSNGDKTENSSCDKTLKLKLWQNSKTPIKAKLKNSNCDKTQKLKLWQH